MPKADPAQWKEARHRWETTELTYSEVASMLNVSVPTVSLRARRELWLKSEVVQLDRVNYSPRELVEMSLRALVRAANQTYDMASAVKAAGMILDRTMGKVAAVQTTPMLPSEAEQAAQEWPEWLTARRLMYQEEGMGEDQPAQALEAPPPAEPTPTPPARMGEAAGPHLVAVEPPPPRFWDSPTRPAQG